MSRVLVISPHPDDEAIGCGGSLRRHAVQGDEVRVIFLTSGERGGHGRSAEETVRIREQEAEDSAIILGVSKIAFWHLPDGALRADLDISKRLAAILVDWRPDLIYVTHPDEMHPDHRAAARIVQRALPAARGLDKTPEVWMYEVWTPLQVMDEIVDISDYIDYKIAAIQAHKSQCAVVRFDEAALALNRYRGELHSWPGGDYAEVFRRLRR